MAITNQNPRTRFLPLFFAFLCLSSLVVSIERLNCFNFEFVWLYIQANLSSYESGDNPKEKFHGPRKATRLMIRFNRAMNRWKRQEIKRRISIKKNSSGFCLHNSLQRQYLSTPKRGMMEDKKGGLSKSDTHLTRQEFGRRRSNHCGGQTSAESIERQSRYWLHEQIISLTFCQLNTILSIWKTCLLLSLGFKQIVVCLNEKYSKESTTDEQIAFEQVYFEQLSFEPKPTMLEETSSCGNEQCSNEQPPVEEHIEQPPVEEHIETNLSEQHKTLSNANVTGPSGNKKEKAKGKPNFDMKTYVPGPFGLILNYEAVTWTLLYLPLYGRACNWFAAVMDISLYFWLYLNPNNSNMVGRIIKMKKIEKDRNEKENTNIIKRPLEQSNMYLKSAYDYPFVTKYTICLCTRNPSYKHQDFTELLSIGKMSIEQTTPEQILVEQMALDMRVFEQIAFDQGSYERSSNEQLASDPYPVEDEVGINVPNPTLAEKTVKDGADPHLRLYLDTFANNVVCCEGNILITCWFSTNKNGTIY